MVKQNGSDATTKGKHWNDLILINVLVIILVISILLIPSNTIRAFLGFPFILLFSGYVLNIALFPQKSELDGTVRLALSLGLSIAATVIVCLILNLTSWGITLETLLYSLASFIIILSVVAWLRQRRFLPEERYGTRYMKLSLTFGKTVRERTLKTILIIAILGTIGTISLAIFNSKIGQTFTEFYILGTDGTADYPQQIKVGSEGNVLLGLVNNEGKMTNYSIAVEIDGNKVSELGALTLAAGGKWEQEVTFVPNSVGKDQEVDFILYMNGDDEPYMEPLRLWIDVIQ
jgi:uncharacterized membrane protein